MAKQIYYLQSCDIWKSCDSMSLLFIGTSQRKLMTKISKEIESGNMNYKPVTSEYDYVNGEWKLVDKRNSLKEQARLFRKDWKTEDRRTINSALEYGYYDYTYDNAEI